MKTSTAKVRANLNPVTFVIIVLFLLAIFGFFSAFLAFAGWLHTYRVLTNEKRVGELHISKKIIKNGVPAARIKVIFYRSKPNLSWLLGEIDEQKVELEVNGDIVYIEANFIRWQNWLVMLGFEPVYKIYRLKSDYKNLSDAEKYGRTAIDLNGGYDSSFDMFNQKVWWSDFLFQSVFISSAGQAVQDKEDRVYYIVITKDAVVLEPK